MEIINPKPQLRLTPEDENFIRGMVEFSKELKNLCNEIVDCEDCPIRDACHEIIVGRPDSLEFLFQSLLDNSI